MKKPITFAAIGLASVILCGCASYTIQPRAGKQLGDDWASNKADKGYVFYEPELYFLVVPGSVEKPAADKKAGTTTTQAESKVTVTPMYFPNPRKAYQLTTFNFLAKSDFEFKFQDGWQLTSISDKSDNSTVVNTLAGQLASVLSATMKGPNAPEESFLLHPEYGDDGIITKFTPIRFPLKPKQ